MNRLAKEKSPYLLQHKDNPVDWYPWSEEAFSKANELDRPVFLSIGYSTCHWCHVMEHESFEDEQIASLMNSAFVNIKVDREERPDLDNIYMDVCRMLTGGGGWPLTIIMTPDKKPFFAGTYYPRESHYNRIGMIELVPKIQELWQTRKDDLVESADEITSRIAGLAPSGDIPDKSILETAFSNFIASFDTHYGGFGSAPKFPMPHNYSFLIRHWKNSNDPVALQMIEKSLSEMRMGGIFDQLGGGFHRYSTDDKWLVPHFEKMLYDQALLAIAYTEVYQATGNEFYKNVASEILDYVQLDMTTDKGAFCTAEDADSEGIEGKYYNWSLDEVKWILGDDSEEFIANYNVTSEGNFVDPHYPEIKGMNILNLSSYSIDKIESMKNSRDKLLAIRGERIRPLKDDKVLTDWNGLMIAAFAKAGFAFNNDPYKQTARNAADFILENMLDSENNLFHRWREGERAYRANLDDYAFICFGLIELYSSIFEPIYLKKAIELTDKMIELFSADNGAFYFSSAVAKDLIARNQEFYDGAIPSGNSIAMMNILKLWKYTGNESYRNKAESIAKAYAPQISKYPGGFSAFLSAFDFMTGATAELVIVEGSQGDSKEMIEIVRSGFYPNLIVTLINDKTIEMGIKNILSIVNNFLAIDNKTTAYLCRNFACERPINDIEEFKKMLLI